VFLEQPQLCALFGVLLVSPSQHSALPEGRVSDRRSAGGSTGSPRWRMKRATLFGSVTRASTTNRGGLVVRARLDKRKYPTGKKVSAKEFCELKIERDTFHGDWNYMFRPRKERR
jgi:hypothetical protein